MAALEWFRRRLGETMKAPVVPAWPAGSDWNTWARPGSSDASCCWSVIPSWLAASVAWLYRAPVAVSVGSTMACSVVRLGMICLYSSSCLAIGSRAPNTPVRLPPGLERLCTRPSRTGSDGCRNTTGIRSVAAAVASCAARIDLSSKATIRSTRSSNELLGLAFDLASGPGCATPDRCASPGTRPTAGPSCPGPCCHRRSIAA